MQVFLFVCLFLINILQTLFNLPDESHIML